MQKIVKIAKIFSDINRIKIFALLAKYNELCVCEICDTLQLSQPQVSRHLKQMREAGILQTIQKKQWVFYSIPKTKEPFLEYFKKEINNNLSNLPKLIVCKKK
jgi:ArsR family transcriptional regulator